MSDKMNTEGRSYSESVRGRGKQSGRQNRQSQNDNQQGSNDVPNSFDSKRAFTSTQKGNPGGENRAPSGKRFNKSNRNNDDQRRDRPRAFNNNSEKKDMNDEDKQPEGETTCVRVDLSKDKVTDECWDATSVVTDQMVDTSAKVLLNPTAVEFRPNFAMGVVESQSSNTPVPLITSSDAPGDDEEKAVDGSVVASSPTTNTSLQEELDWNKSSITADDRNETTSSIASSDAAWDGDVVASSATGKLQGGKYKPSSSVSKPISHKDRNITRPTPEGDDSFADRSREYDAFEKRYRSLKDKGFKVVEEMEADLFAMSDEYAVANCVASDFNMGSGIAITFRQLFKGVDQLLAQNQTQGGLAFLEVNGRYVYYLVTKRISTGKPTYETMFRSLTKLHQHMVENGVKLLAIPRLGCGLDRLEWSKVKVMIEYLFQDTDIKITVCNFQKADETMSSKKEWLVNRKCPVNHTSQPISAASAYSIILYIGTVNGHVDKHLDNIDHKYNSSILQNYKKSPRELGQLVVTNVNNYKFYVVGCIAKKSLTNLIDYQSFEKCIKEVNKINQKFGKTNDNYSTVSIPSYYDPADPMLMTKLENLLKNTFCNVTINIHDTESK